MCGRTLLWSYTVRKTLLLNTVNNTVWIQVPNYVDLFCSQVRTSYVALKHKTPYFCSSYFCSIIPFSKEFSHGVHCSLRKKLVLIRTSFYFQVYTSQVALKSRPKNTQQTEGLGIHIVSPVGHKQNLSGERQSLVGVRTWRLSPALTIAMMMFSEAMKGSSCFTCFSITYKGLIDK